MSRRRTHGSVRFDPYHKIQWYDVRSMTWRDVQKHYDTADEAIAAFPADKRCRVMFITEHGRYPLPSTEAQPR